MTLYSTWKLRNNQEYFITDKSLNFAFDKMNDKTWQFNAFSRSKNNSENFDKIPINWDEIFMVTVLIRDKLTK